MGSVGPCKARPPQPRKAGGRQSRRGLLSGCSAARSWGGAQFCIAPLAPTRADAAVRPARWQECMPGLRALPGGCRAAVPLKLGLQAAARRRRRRRRRQRCRRRLSCAAHVDELQALLASAWLRGEGRNGAGRHEGMRQPKTKRNTTAARCAIDRSRLTSDLCSQRAPSERIAAKG